MGGQGETDRSFPLQDKGKKSKKLKKPDSTTGKKKEKKGKGDSGTGGGVPTTADGNGALPVSEKVKSAHAAPKVEEVVDE